MSSRKPLHEALAAAKLVEGSGGSGGTSDYTQLTNKPQINSVTLSGNKSLSDLGIEWVWRGTRAQYEAAAATIPPNTFVDITDEPDMDSVPTDGSTNPVESNGVYDALAEKMPASTKYGASLLLTIDSSTYVVTATLKDQDGNTLGTAQAIDLPLETMVVGGSYDAQTKKVILTLKNGQTVEFSVADLVAGLQTEITASSKLSADLVDDKNTTNKFVSAAERTSIGTSATKLTGVDSSATDYIQLANGKRLYLSDAEPTGTISNGAIWIGGTVT